MLLYVVNEFVAFGLFPDILYTAHFSQLIYVHLLYTGRGQVSAPFL